MKLGKMSPEQLMAARMETDLVNSKVNHGKERSKGTADKDMFMKLLVTQLKYQDPTKPMEDREFIAQMAQFSSLEQMTNINKELANLLKSSRSSEAFSLLGKEIDSLNPQTNRRVSGIVSAIQYNGDEQVLMVGREQVGINDISAVRNPEPVIPGAAEAKNITGSAQKNMVENAIRSGGIVRTSGMDTVQAK
jgi:flagellar basal-body rod modification protein FlgD